MRTSGVAPAASAWKYCALPISPGVPSRPATTRAWLLMFCALNGATRRPWRAYQRHSAVASQVVPAPLVQPSTITARAVTWALPGTSIVGSTGTPDARRGIVRGTRGTPRTVERGPQEGRPAGGSLEPRCGLHSDPIRTFTGASQRAWPARTPTGHHGLAPIPTERTTHRCPRPRPTPCTPVHVIFRPAGRPEQPPELRRRWPADRLTTGERML